MPDNAKFIIDTNVLIEAYQRYYSFDIAPIFWDSILKEIKNGNIIIIDRVANEIEKGDDKLKNWVCGKCKNYIYDSNKHIISYSVVINHLNECGFYKNNAVKEWSDDVVADPWIIAVALDLKYVVVTNEVSQNRNKGETYNRAKIPNIANDLDVKCIDVFQMLRLFHIKFN